VSSKELNDDQMTLVMVGIFGGPTAAAAGLAWLGSKSPWLTDQLVRYYVLAPASAKPLLPIPGLGGAGLDLARIVILTALILIPLIWLVHYLRRPREARPS
jgi:uncharacterized membrane protein YtjA (UPF0391 family)